MAGKTMGAAEFKAHCLRIIERVNRDRTPVTITKRGNPMVDVVPAQKAERRPLFGALKGTVLKYERPFDPASDPDDWNAVRDHDTTGRSADN
jgi:prevent-host-death family protein